MPIGVASFAAVSFLFTAHDGTLHDRATFALMLFGAIGGWWLGFDVAGAALMRRWESATGLGLYRPQCRVHWGRVQTVHVAVAERPASRVPRYRLPALLAGCGLLLLIAASAGLGVLRANETPWNVAIPTQRADTPASHIDPVIGATASLLAGRPVEVRCWSASDWARFLRVRHDSVVGFADVRGSRIHLAPQVCQPLMSLAYDRAYPPAGSAAEYALSFAVVALGHEVGHLRLGHSESAAECYGLRSATQTARLLGTDDAYARLLEMTYRYRIYPFRGAVYRAGGCA